MREHKYVKDLLSTSKTFKLDEQREKVIFPTGEEISCLIRAKDSSKEYYFIGIRDYDSLLQSLYFGVFKKNSDGNLYEIEPEGKNRETLNKLDVFLNEELFDVEMLKNDKILVLAIKNLIRDDWDALIYELVDRKKLHFADNLSDFML